jgi:hypothetical protein
VCGWPERVPDGVSERKKRPDEAARAASLSFGFLEIRFPDSRQFKSLNHNSFIEKALRRKTH